MINAKNGRTHSLQTKGLNIINATHTKATITIEGK